MGIATLERHTDPPRGADVRRVDRPMDVALWDASMRRLGLDDLAEQAEAAGASERALRRIRKGEYLPRLDLALRMEELAEVPLKELFPAPRTPRQRRSGGAG